MNIYKVSFARKSLADLRALVDSYPGPLEIIRSLCNDKIALVRTDEAGKEFLTKKVFWPVPDDGNRSPETWRSGMEANYGNNEGFGELNVSVVLIPDVGGPDVVVFEAVHNGGLPLIDPTMYARNFETSEVARTSNELMRNKFIPCDGFAYSVRDPEYYTIMTPNQMFKVITNDRELSEAEITELAGSLALRSVK